jgi:hypothetical protein
MDGSRVISHGEPFTRVVHGKTFRFGNCVECYSCLPIGTFHKDCPRRKRVGVKGDLPCQVVPFGYYEGVPASPTEVSCYWHPVMLEHMYCRTETFPAGSAKHRAARIVTKYDPSILRGVVMLRDEMETLDMRGHAIDRNKLFREMQTAEYESLRDEVPDDASETLRELHAADDEVFKKSVNSRYAQYLAFTLKAQKVLLKWDHTKGVHGSGELIPLSTSETVIRQNCLF